MDKVIQIAKASINITQLKDLKKSDFKEMFKGKLSIDLEEAWKVFEQHKKSYNKSK